MTLNWELMSEDDLQCLVIDLAQRYGWTVAHFRPAETKKGWRTAVSADGVGFPDLILVKGHRLLVVELKKEDGKLAAEQYFWLLKFLGVEAEVYLWKPSDEDEFTAVLTGRRLQYVSGESAMDLASALREII